MHFTAPDAFRPSRPPSHEAPPSFACDTTATEISHKPKFHATVQHLLNFCCSPTTSKREGNAHMHSTSSADVIGRRWRRQLSTFLEVTEESLSFSRNSGRTWSISRFSTPAALWTQQFHTTSTGEGGISMHAVTPVHCGVCWLVWMSGGVHVSKTLQRMTSSARCGEHARV